MINSNMKEYDYYTYGERDSYGQPKLSEKKGTVKLSIFLQSETTVDGRRYLDGEYVGLTHDKNIDNTYVIQYGAERLKVKSVIPARYNQVLLSRM